MEKKISLTPFFLTAFKKINVIIRIWEKWKKDIFNT